MSLIELTSGYVDHILGGLGQCMKSLLMDGDTMSAVSVSCPQSQLMSKGVYLFERLDERRRVHKAAPLSFVTCVCLASPTREHVDHLKQELQNPRFGKYHLYFTRHLQRPLLKELAEADLHESVKSIAEIPLDFCALDSHVFSVRSSQDKDLSFADETDCLWSLLRSRNLGSSVSVCHMRASGASKALADALAEKIRLGADDEQGAGGGGGGRERTVLLVFDRRLDPITPFLTQWTYQAMIHEMFGIRNNVVDLSKCAEVPKELEKIVLSSQSDEFFSHNMYKDFGEIGETIRRLIADFQSKKKSHQNIENIGDIKDFISNYPEFKKMSGTVTKHVNLVSEISRFVTSHSLMRVSEFEQNLCSNSGGGIGRQQQQQNILPSSPMSSSSSEASELKELLTAPNVRGTDKIKLLCLYFIHRGCSLAQVSQFLDLVARAAAVERSFLERLLRNLACYSPSQSTTSMFQNPSTIAAKKFFKGLRGVENVYTQHQPVIHGVLTDLMKKRVSPDVVYPENFAFSSNVMLYCVDGFTYEEAKVVRDVNMEFGSSAVIGGRKVWRSESFITYLSSRN